MIAALFGIMIDRGGVLGVEGRGGLIRRGYGQVGNKKTAVSKEKKQNIKGRKKYESSIYLDRQRQ